MGRRKTAKIAALSALIGICATLSACVHAQHLRPADIRPLPYSTGGPGFSRVDGVCDALKKSRNEPVRILYVHGMIINKRWFAEEMQAAIAKHLRTCMLDGKPTVLAAEKQGPFNIERGYTVSPWIDGQPFEGAAQSTSGPLPQSEMTKTVWRDSGGVVRVIGYELRWALLRDAIKQRFLSCFESHSLDEETKRLCKDHAFSDAKPNGDSRHWINGTIKDYLMVKGFADATIVLGETGDVLRDDVRLAFCAMARDVLSDSKKAVAVSFSAIAVRRCDLTTEKALADKPAEAAQTLEQVQFFSITDSLGSFLVLDARRQELKNRAETPDQISRETLSFYLLDDLTVFMMANQVPLLQLARLTMVCLPSAENAKCPNDRLSTVDDQIKAPSPLQTMAKLVAFNDIDDDLGFELPPYMPDTGLFGGLVNVSVRNPTWSIPFLLKDPAGTHTHQHKNPAIVEAVTDGFDLPNTVR